MPARYYVRIKYDYIWIVMLLDLNLLIFKCALHMIIGNKTSQISISKLDWWNEHNDDNIVYGQYVIVDECIVADGWWFFGLTNN